LNVVSETPGKCGDCENRPVESSKEMQMEMYSEFRTKWTPQLKYLPHLLITTDMMLLEISSVTNEHLQILQV
jgi:hypothetical protein